jgi:hypothetical protein
MRGYFDVDRPVYPWFDHLKRVLGGMHLSYTDGAVVHLDVVQEATWPAWSGTKAAKELQPEIAKDSEFLRWELETFPISLVLANGRTPWNWLCKETQATDIKGERATQWLEWMVGRGTLLGREAWVAGWTQALHQPTGLGNKGESALGEKLATELSNLGYLVPVR